MNINERSVLFRFMEKHLDAIQMECKLIEYRTKMPIKIDKNNLQMFKSIQLQANHKYQTETSNETPLINYIILVVSSSLSFLLP